MQLNITIQTSFSIKIQTNVFYVNLVYYLVLFYDSRKK
jgi:hypothetical protein